MLHFAYYTANNHRSEYKKFLNEKFQELGIGKYEKNMDNIFEILMNAGNSICKTDYRKWEGKDTGIDSTWNKGA